MNDYTIPPIDVNANIIYPCNLPKLVYTLYRRSALPGINLVFIERFFMHRLSSISFFITVLFLFCFSVARAAGTTSLTTYYPAPAGNYQQLRLVPQAQPAGTPPCATGTMYVDNTAGSFKLHYCDNANGDGTGNWVSAGPWTQAGDLIYPTDTAPLRLLKVGIRTNAPESPLDISGTSAAAGDGTEIVSIRESTGTTRLNFGVKNQEYAWIDVLKSGTGHFNLSLLPVAGNVGIGVTTPANSTYDGKILDLSGAKNNAYTLHSVNNLGVTTQEASLAITGDELRLDVSGAPNATSNRFIFRTEETNGQNTPTERMRISSVGNIGIGQMEPEVKLDVAGDVRVGANKSFIARQTDAAGDGSYRATLNWSGLQLGNSGANYIVAGRTERALGGGSLVFITNQTADMPVVDGTVAMTISNAARVGIGANNATPLSQLDVRGGSFRVSDDAAGAPANTAYVQGANGIAFFGALGDQKAAFGNSEGFQTLIADDGKIGIGLDVGTVPAQVLDVKGNANISGNVTIGGNLNTAGNHIIIGTETVTGALTAGSFNYPSDARLKKDILPLAGALDKVNQLQGVSFTWKKDDAKDIGVIAQEVEKIVPEIVKTDANGMKSVEYGNMVALLIEAVKEQQKQIEDLKKQVAVLENRPAH